jgi:hypothetical protein
MRAIGNHNTTADTVYPPCSMSLTGKITEDGGGDVDRGNGGEEECCTGVVSIREVDVGERTSSDTDGRC